MEFKVIFLALLSLTFDTGDSSRHFVHQNQQKLYQSSNLFNNEQKSNTQTHDSSFQQRNQISPFQSSSGGQLNNRFPSLQKASHSFKKPTTFSHDPKSVNHFIQSRHQLRPQTQIIRPTPQVFRKEDSDEQNDKNLNIKPSRNLNTFPAILETKTSFEEQINSNERFTDSRSNFFKPTQGLSSSVDSGQKSVQHHSSSRISSPNNAETSLEEQEGQQESHEHQADRQKESRDRFNDQIQKKSDQILRAFPQTFKTKDSFSDKDRFNDRFLDFDERSQQPQRNFFNKERQNNKFVHHQHHFTDSVSSAENIQPSFEELDRRQGFQQSTVDLKHKHNQRDSQSIHAVSEPDQSLEDPGTIFKTDFFKQPTHKFITSQNQSQRDLLKPKPQTFSSKHSEEFENQIRIPQTPSQILRSFPTTLEPNDLSIEENRFNNKAENFHTRSHQPKPDFFPEELSRKKFIHHQHQFTHSSSSENAQESSEENDDELDSQNDTSDSEFQFQDDRLSNHQIHRASDSSEQASNNFDDSDHNTEKFDSIEQSVRKTEFSSNSNFSLRKQPTNNFSSPKQDNRNFNFHEKNVHNFDSSSEHRGTKHTEFETLLSKSKSNQHLSRLNKFDESNEQEFSSKSGGDSDHISRKSDSIEQHVRKSESISKSKFNLRTEPINNFFSPKQDNRNFNFHEKNVHDFDSSSEHRGIKHTESESLLSKSKSNKHLSRLNQFDESNEQEFSSKSDGDSDHITRKSDFIEQPASKSGSISKSKFKLHTEPTNNFFSPKQDNRKFIFNDKNVHDFDSSSEHRGIKHKDSETLLSKKSNRRNQFDKSNEQEFSPTSGDDSDHTTGKSDFIEQPVSRTESFSKSKFNLRTEPVNNFFSPKQDNRKLTFREKNDHNFDFSSEHREAKHKESETLLSKAKSIQHPSRISPFDDSNEQDISPKFKSQPQHSSQFQQQQHKENPKFEFQTQLQPYSSFQPNLQRSSADKNFGYDKYSFDYRVHDSKTGTTYGNQEQRSGDQTNGFYYVHLPDGRLQKVSYEVNGDSGYVAKVTYE